MTTSNMRIVWVALTGVVVAGSLAFLRSTDTPIVGTAPPRLEVGAGDGGSALTSDKPYGTFYIGPLCLSKPGKAKILSVEPISVSGDAEITNFSTFPMGQLTGKYALAPDRLNQLSQFKGSDDVSETCDSSEMAETQLAIEVHNPGDDDAVVQGFRTRYESAGKVHVATTPFWVGLCRSATCPLTDR